MHIHILTKFGQDPRLNHGYMDALPSPVLPCAAFGLNCKQTKTTITPQWMAGDALGYILTKGNGKVNMVEEEETEREREGESCLSKATGH